MTDREYLAKPVLPNMKYEITDSRIYIANENTVFIQANNIEKFRQEDILDRYKELLAVCKKYGVKISYTNKYTTKRKSNLATIPLGYMDGINKTRERDTFSKIDNLKASLKELKNLFKTKRLKVCINGKECDIVGRLGTLHAIIDVTDIECEVGDEVL